MARAPRPTALFWGLVATLGITALVLRQQTPGHAALPWVTGSLLGLLALRVAGLFQAWRSHRLPATRMLLPAVILVEGLSLSLAGAPLLALRAKVATGLALEALLIVLAGRSWREAAPGTWPEDRIATAFTAFVPPGAARLMALELVMLGSALRFLFGGFRHPAPAGFSHHRESSLRAILPALPLMLPGDVLLVRLIGSGLAPWLRLLLHGSSLYAVVWLLGFYASLKDRPHQIHHGEVVLHRGPLATLHFPVALVTAAAPLPEFDDDWARHAYEKGLVKLGAKGSPAVELTLSEPVRVSGLFGPGKPVTRVAVTVDQPAAFRAALGF